MPDNAPARKGRDPKPCADPATQPARKPGRPRLSERPATKATLTNGYLTRAAAIVQRLLDQPRSKAAKADAAGLVADIQRRLAPTDPSHKGSGPGRPARTKAWDVGLADGTIRRCNSLAEAATAYGVKETSLNAMLAKNGKGYARRKHGDALIWCRRVAE